MAVIMVGAIFVSSIETVWAGEVTPPTRPSVRNWQYDNDDQSLQFDKGDEIGRFNMGSTVIVIFPENTVQWNINLKNGAAINLGMEIARLKH
jgi:phosphatidylserine decarboxylase